jgi:uncharacterized membrane protein
MILPFFIPMAAYVVLSLLVAYMGHNTKFGFWGNFWVSFILTPIVGVVVLIAQDRRPDRTSR